jgi:Flp pilus assembly pilin Flp
MRSLSKLAKRFWSDENGAEITEVGIYLALIVAACVVVMAAIGPIILGGWEQVRNALGVAP